MWQTSRCNSSSFLHPSIQIMHHLISSTILDTGGYDGKISTLDLVLLWGLLTPYSHPDDQIRTTTFLIRRLQVLANSSSIVIVQGGLIISIARFYDDHHFLD